MDTGLAVRPTPSTAQPNVVRHEPAPAQQAVATDLTPAQSVTASNGSSETTRQDSAQTAQDAHVRKVILDAHSREVIYQVLDAGSGRVVRQVPDEAMLRLRAYTRALAQGRTPNEASRADLEA